VSLVLHSSLLRAAKKCRSRARNALPPALPPCLTVALVVELERVLDAVVVLDPVLRRKRRERTHVSHDLAVGAHDGRN